ncbi:MAG: YgiQ family radical SAM protein [Negativicutes bacterium]|nr:YgiQ family radical SAM protein [Negativicutes bacterium]
MSEFLPISLDDIEKRGWNQIDFLFVSGDAYVDHPSFGPAVICRVLESKGYKVAMLCQPDWKNKQSLSVLGKPRLGVLISGGNLDSMLCHYTAARKLRKKDNYTPGGIMGKRPDHATVVYSKMAKRLWPELPVVIGGIEASLRRFAHYDYWKDKLLPTILTESGADLLVYGMGEKQIVEIADYLAGGANISTVRYVRGTAYLCDDLEGVADDHVLLPSYEAILKNKELFARAYKLQSGEQDPFYGKVVVQQSGTKYVVQNQSTFPLSEEEMDAVYDLPYCRTYHPSYEKFGGIPAIEEVKFSIISQRGCFGSCSFCAIHSHQGRIIQARSHESILREARLISELPDFKGYIHDVGGPTANFRHAACEKQLKVGACKNRQCLFPNVCPSIDADHSDYVALLRKVRALPGIKKVFIRSGIRYDYLLADESRVFLDELCRYHVSGQLKIAPEHVSPNVLKYMGKPGKEVYLKFLRLFNKKNQEIGLKQFVVPYFISSHPGCTINDAVELAEFLRDTGHYPEQVQDFIPTPGSCSTAMYYSGIDPETGKKVFVTQNPHEKAMQRALMQYKNPKNRNLVKEALQLANRSDLIGSDSRCLLRLSQARPGFSSKMNGKKIAEKAKDSRMRKDTKRRK